MKSNVFDFAHICALTPQELFSGTRTFFQNHVHTAGTRPDCSSSGAVPEHFFMAYPRLDTFRSNTNYCGGAYRESVLIGWP